MAAPTYAYDPWGNTTTSTGALATTNPWHYAGSYTDTATGYLKLGARYYNPTTARFTQPDPAHTCGGYAYAGDDPANNTDPTGRSCVAAGLAGGAVGFVVGAVAASPADIPTVGLASVAVGIDVGINTGLATYISCELAGLLSSWGL
jgi:RHS repeat-associated protein